MNLHVRAMTAMVGVAILGLAACGGERTSTLSSGAAGQRSAAAVAPTTSGATGCDAPEVKDVPTPDAATTRQLLIGSWLLCDSPSFFGTTNEKGLVIAADGHWAKLASLSAGSAVEMAGAANRGAWQLIDTSAANGPGHFQINFTGLDGGDRISPVRVIAPAKLLLNNNGVFVARYVRADVTVAPPPASGGSGCDAPEVKNVPTPDAATTRQLVIGSWLLCDSPSFFGTTDEKGLVIAADGHWAKLASLTAGSAVEMAGAANRGTWQLVDTSTANGPGNFQINFTGLDGGDRISPVRVVAPAKLLLNNGGVFVARYVRADVTVAPPQQVAPPVQGQPSLTG